MKKPVNIKKIILPNLPYLLFALLNQVWAGCAVSTGAGLLSKGPAYSGWLPAGL